MSKQLLYELDASSTLLTEQLNELLRDTKWIDELKTLPEDDLVGLAGHLSNVWLTAVPTILAHQLHRFSIVPIARACHRGGVFACCGEFAVLGRFSPQRMKYPASFRSPPHYRSRSGDSSMSTKGPCLEKMFVLNDFGYPPRTIRSQLNE